MRSAIAAILMFAVASPAMAVNLIVNGDFEAGSLIGWTANSTTAAKITTVATNIFAGDYAAQLHTSNQTAKNLIQIVATQQGYSYELSYWLRNNGNAIDSFVAASGNVTSSFGNRTPFNFTNFT